MKNNSRTVQLTFDITDLPMLAAALSIARNTAMLEGYKIAQERLENYRETVQQMIPREARIFHPDAWAEIGELLANADGWKVSIKRPHWRREEHWVSDGHIVITVGGRQWRSRECHFKDDGPEMVAVRDILMQVSPLGVDELCDTRQQLAP